jgi:branched-chain amino acid transport system substrate-binding protein
MTCLTPCYDTTFPTQIGSFWNDKLWSNSEFSMLDSDGEDNLNWRQVIKEYGTADQPRDSFSQGGYLAARVLVEALLALDPEDVSRDTVSAAIQDIKGFETDMLCQPWYFAGPNGHNNANHQLFNVKLGADGEFEEANDCFETQDPGLADVIAFEKANPDVLTGG